MGFPHLMGVMVSRYVTVLRKQGHVTVPWTVWGNIGNRIMCCTMERQERALNMSKKTKQVKVMVVSLGVIILSSICRGRERDTEVQERRENGK